ncbi:MAG: NAD(P)-dependent oxidoreductase [Pseudomonadota bacterium]
MSLLVTGGTGFVMSNLVRHWLERHEDQRVVLVDIAEPDAMARRFFEPVAGRLTAVTGDVRNRDLLPGLAEEHDIDRLVHGAAMTPTSGTTEATQAAMIAGVNVMGTVHALELARALPDLKRMIHVSTGSVYDTEGPADGSPLPEDGYVRPFPTTLYPITKLTGELIASRYRDLFHIPLHIARLASVYGPMDRWTPGRDYACDPNVLVHKAVAGEPVTIAGAEAVGDFIHSGDVARAIADMLDAPALNHDVYNIAYGEPVTLAGLADIVASTVPGFTWSPTTNDDATLTGNPARKSGAWGAYDITRLKGDTGWSPRPLNDAIADYVAWVRDIEEPAG